MHVQRKVKCVPEESNTRVLEVGIEIVGVKSVSISKIYFSSIKNGPSPPFVKQFGLTSGTSVRGMIGLIYLYYKDP